MTSVALSPFLALILALSSFFAPTLATEADLPAFSISLTDGTESVSVGLVDTTAEIPAAFIFHNDEGLYIAGDTVILDDEPGACSISAQELLMAQYIGTSLPAFTEEDAAALVTFAQQLVGTVSSKAVSLVSLSGGMTFRVDVDQLIADLNAGVPQVLTDCATILDPVLNKYATFLMGAPITCAQLVEVWPELGLADVKTGLTMNLTVTTLNDGSTMIMGKVADLSFTISVSETAFELSVTTPDGVTYALNTNDFITIASLLMQVPNYITTDAVSAYETTGMNDAGKPTSDMIITLDTTMLARDLNNGFQQVILANADVVDSILVRYASWLQLIDPSLGNLSAAKLGDLFAQGGIILPEIKAEVVLSAYDSFVTVDGYATGDCGLVTLNGNIYSGWYDTSVAFTLAVNDSYNPLVLNLEYVSSYNDERFSFTSSQPIFDLFSTVNYTFDYYNNTISLTTDTNVLHFIFSGEEQYISAKLGPATAGFREDENDAIHAYLYLPEFYFDMHQTDDSITIDSTFFGLDLFETWNGAVLNGYLQPGVYEDRIAFGLEAHEYESIIHAYLLSDDLDYSLNFAGNTLTITCEDEVYSLVSDGHGTVKVYYDYEVVCSIISYADGDVLTLNIFQGDDVTGDPDFILTIDLSPEAITLPEADAVDAYEFLTRMSIFFQ